MSTKSLLLACASLSVVALAAPAFAADSPSEGSAPAAGAPNSTRPANQPATTLDVVVVHARKRAEAITEVPLAITAVTPKMLEQESITQVEDIGRVAPDVSVHSSNGTGTALQSVIRGQTSFAPSIFVDGAVGYYFDGVYVAQGAGLPAALFDLSGIEIARGVQGTLNGRNNTGGSISFYTQKPILGRYQADLSVTGGSLGTAGGSVMANIPIGDTLALRLDYDRADEGAWGHSTVTGQGFGGFDQNGWRASLLWKPAENVQASLVYEGGYITQNPTAGRMAPGSPAIAPAEAKGYTLSQLQPSNWWDNSASLTEPWITRTESVRGNVQWEINPNLTAKLITGYHYAGYVGGLDVTGSPIAVATTRFGDTSHELTFEPQLLGRAFGGRLDWVAGYFYFMDAGSYYAAGANYAAGIFHSCVTPPVNGTFCADGTNISNAAYLHGEYKITDKWKVAAGIRYTQDIRKVDQINYVPGVPLFAPYNHVDFEKTFEYPSYEVSTHYDLSDHVHPYFRTGRGSRSGGFSPPIASAVATQGFRPESLTDYEVGVKTNGLLDGKLDFDLDYYYGFYDNVQRYESAPGIGGVYSDVVLNAAKAHIQGVEADYSYKILPRLTLSGWGSWTDFEYDSFPFLAGDGSTVNLASSPAYLTPKYMTRFGGAYRLPVSVGELTLSGGWDWQSKEALYLFAYPGMEQAAYSLVDLRLNWTSPERKWEVALYSTNLTNTHYATVGQVNGSPNPMTGSLTQGISSSEYTVGEPQVVAVKLTYHFR